MTLPAEGGLLLVDKPEGPTSHDVVAGVRRSLGVRRIGHTGTLDPFASGLLLLCVGPATRLVEYFHVLPKTYRATLRLGVTMDTDDRTGTELERSDGWMTVGREDCLAAMRVVGDRTSQIPPAYSAKKKQGTRAYQAARRGEAVELDPVPVRIHSLELVSFEPPEVQFESIVSTGTYVRALARDVGGELGCGAHLTTLRRTRIGPFDVADAAGPGEVGAGSELTPSWKTPAESVSDWMPARALNEEEVRRVCTGQAVPAGSIGPEGGDSSPIALLAEGRLIAIAERGADRLKPRKVLQAC